jgi:hypothetical protein
MSPDVRFGDAGVAVAALLEAEREPLAVGGREDGTKPLTAAARQAADTRSEKVLMIGRCVRASARVADDEKLREKRRLERETRIVHGLPPLLPTFCMRNCASIVRFFGGSNFRDRGSCSCVERWSGPHERLEHYRDIEHAN